MDPDSGTALFTALNVLALVLSTLAIAGSVLTWWFSRAQNVRAFEGRVYEQLTTAHSRIETVESAWGQHKAEISGLVDELMEQAHRAAKDRRRVYAENQRAANAAEKKGSEVEVPEVVESPEAARARELSEVRLRLAGRV